MRAGSPKHLFGIPVLRDARRFNSTPASVSRAACTLPCATPNSRMQQNAPRKTCFQAQARYTCQRAWMVRRQAEGRTASPQTEIGSQEAEEEIDTYGVPGTLNQTTGSRRRGGPRASLVTLDTRQASLAKTIRRRIGTQHSTRYLGFGLASSSGRFLAQDNKQEVHQDGANPLC